MIKSLKSQVNMLEGPLLKNIIFYAVPVMLTGILQLLFNAADLVVVGQFCGSLSVAAVGSTNSLVNLLTNLFLGLSAGAGVVMATSLGAKDKNAAFKTVHTAIPLALSCGIILTIIGVLACEPLLRMMNAPEDIIGLSAIYMRIYFGGIAFTLLYNFGAAILRATGDTQSPLIYLTISGVVNVILNIIFVTVFNMNVAGVALATTLSQAVSAILVIIRLIRRDDEAKFFIGKMRFYKAQFVKILSIGLPSGIQSSLFAISNVLIQSSVNSFGSAAVSGAAAASSIEGFVYIIMNAFHHTALNFAGQNMGARNYKRIKQVAKTTLISVTVVGIVCSGIMYLLAKPLLGIYITNSSEAIRYGLIKLTFICLPYFVCGLLDTVNGLLRGMGSSIAPMLITVFGTCVFRVVWIYTVFQHYRSYEVLLSSYLISWLITFIVEIILFAIILKKKEKRYNLQKEQKSE